jgi:hypothetical protein
MAAWDEAPAARKDRPLETPVMTAVEMPPAAVEAVVMALVIAVVPPAR